MSLLSSILAINWEPELRGILIVIIAVVSLNGTVYLVMATNLGARLGFLVALTGLAGWMALMGFIWMIYGIGLKGEDPTWKAVSGRTVLQDSQALVQSEVLDGIGEIPDDASFTDEADVVAAEFGEEGWELIDPSSPAFGQAGASAGTFLEEEGAFAAGEFEVQRIFDIGGERYPKLGEAIDFLAFFHKPHYVVVEVAALEQTRTEPGRAAPTAEIDETRQRQYVYMIRDLGTRRQPATVLGIGGTLIFLGLCWILHRRDTMVTRNTSSSSGGATTPVPVAGQ
jgi:hypothetical protein